MEIALRHLWTFVAVAEERNFTRAARRAHLTQQATSAHIRRLEEALGVTLFERTTHTVTLTDAGARLLEELVPALDSLEGAFAAARGAGVPMSGVLRIVYTPATGRDLLPELVEQFQRTHPTVAVEAQLLWGDEVLEALDSGAADIGIALEPNESARFRYTELHTGELGIVVARDHHLASKEAVPLVALRDVPIVMPGRDASPRLQSKLVSACELAGFRPQLWTKARLFGATSGAVLRGEAVSPWPSCMPLKYVTEGLVYRAIVSPTIPLSVMLLTARNRPSAVVDRFLSHADPIPTA
jgi:DNA-binding transcriptional LysR family regulator